MDYGLIGGTLGHSFSKEIHEKLADYSYELHPLTKEEFIPFMKAKDFKAMNVTIPYKCEVIPYLDEIDESAKNIGAVNTIVNKEGKLYGHNTDFSGFLYMVQHNHISIGGKKVLVIGNGGAAKAIITALRHLEAKEIVVVDVQPGNGAITYGDCIKNHLDCEIITNTSPVGMYPNIDISPIDVSLFKNCEAALDVVYNPLRTKLTLQAESLSIPGINGLEMLVAQAKYAVEFFLDKQIDDSVIDPIYKEIYKSMSKNDIN